MRPEQYIRRRWGRLLKEAIYIDIPNPNGWDRHWFAVVTFDEKQFHPIPALTQTILTTPTGSLQTSTSPSTWNNANNTVECVGAGASGGVVVANSGHGTGGGGGAYSKITNFVFATPGTTTYQWEAGTGGAAVTTSSQVGNAGGNTWFNDTAFNTGTTNAECSAAGGGAGQFNNSNTVAVNGGTAGATGFGQTITSAGRGGNTAASNREATGGGGAGGPNGAGNQGVDASGTIGTAGGSGDAGHGGAAGSGGTTANGGNGGTATEFDASHGCGGGGGGGENSSASLVTGGSGGIYGGGGGSAVNSSTGGAQSGAGGQGLIVLTWTPGAAKPPAFLNLIGVGGIILSNPVITRRQLAALIEWLRR